jgi:hypothetical protein
MPAAQTYEPLATTTLGSNTNTVTFSSISQSYTDLIIVFNGSNTSNADFRIQVGNGSIDTGTNYSRTVMFGYSGGVVAARDTNNIAWISSSYTNRTNAIIQIMNYSNTTTNKTAIIRNDISTDITYSSVNLWRSTSAINIITLSQPTHNFTAGSTFTLYGIAAA